MLAKLELVEDAPNATVKPKQQRPSRGQTHETRQRKPLQVSLLEERNCSWKLTKVFIGAVFQKFELAICVAGTCSMFGILQSRWRPQQLVQLPLGHRQLVCQLRPK